MTMPYRPPLTGAYKIGFGYDIHRLVAGRKLILGGVRIPFAKGLEGHSDADVLLHALCDALLGALALGDIGEHFPSHDRRYKGISSLILLKRVYRRVLGQGFVIGNIDAVIIAEEPSLKVFKPKMRRTIGRALHLESDRVNIKATTQEGLGFGGFGDGIAAYAVVMLVKSPR